MELEFTKGLYKKIEGYFPIKRSNVDINNYEFISIGVAPSAESGEFHTFVYDGPIFKHKIDFNVSDIHRVGDCFMLDFLL